MSRPVDNTVELLARAKLNPFLRVLGRRDDAYHDLETMVLPLSLADGVRVHAYADPSMFRTLSLSLDVIGESDLTRRVPVDETNLAMRAAAALADAVRPRGFAEIVLEKRIPNAAGLGGGSADAAAVLRALDRLWGAALGAEELAEIGAGVGSDVPALLADGPVVARGRGERLEPASGIAAFAWILVTFPFGVRTQDAFGWWDEDGGVSGPETGLNAAAAGARTGDPAVLGPSLGNDLEGPVTRRHPEIGAAKEFLLGAGLPGAVLCGSGATVAGLLPADLTPAAAAELLDAASTLSGRRALPVRSIGSMEGEESEAP